MAVRSHLTAQLKPSNVVLIYTEGFYFKKLLKWYPLKLECNYLYALTR